MRPNRRHAGSAAEPAIALSQYAWRFRYPGAPYEPDAREAARGRELADQVRVEIGKRLPPDVRNETG